MASYFDPFSLVAFSEVVRLQWSAADIDSRQFLRGAFSYIGASEAVDVLGGTVGGFDTACVCWTPDERELKSKKVAGP